MSNSFYYFFSATPQVMAAVLGLFGILIIFKIQFLDNGLSEVVEILYNESEIKNNIRRIKDESFLRSIQVALKNDDLLELTSLFKNTVSEEIITTCFRHYHEIKRLRKYLVRTTIGHSILTVILIIFCLSIIPLSELFIIPIQLLILFYGLSILITIICFVGFIHILQNAFIQYTR